MRKNRKVLIEIDKLEDDLSSVSEAATEYWNDRSSVSSDILSIDLGVRQGNSSFSSETYQKQEISEVRIENRKINIDETENELSNFHNRTHDNSSGSDQNKISTEQVNTG